MRLRVLSYNIHKCIGGLDRRCRPERIIQTIDHHESDIAFLQEVASGMKHARDVRQVDQLAEALEMPHIAWFANHRFRRGHEYGNAILSRWPVSDVENIDLTRPGKKARSALHARIHVRRPDGADRTLHAFSLHLGLSGRERDVQLLHLLEQTRLSRLHSDTPVIVAGDFNDVWGTLGEKHLVPRGFRGTSPRIRTFPAVAPVRALDSIYVRGDATIERAWRSRLRIARRASDHLPLVADLCVWMRG